MTKDLPESRLVISGLRSGRSAAVADSPVTGLVGIPGLPTVRVTDLWVSDSAPADLTEPPLRPEPGSIGAPRDGGHIVRMLEIAPDPEGYDVMSGWHATPTIDHVIVLDGEIVCIFDEGEVVLGRGDILVQRGVPHAWSNRGTVVCRMLGILVDAAQVPETD